MRERCAGDDAVVIDFSGDSDGARQAAVAAHSLRVAIGTGILAASDVIATAESVLVQAEPGAGLNRALVRRLAEERLASGSLAAADSEVVAIPVIYDGADLTELADLTGADPDEIIAAHQAISWRVQFMGFAPGFGYLVPDNGPAAARELFAGLGRREQSRPAVPTGSVAVAAGYSAVYPGTSPGGWFLLGHTDIAMWDSSADPPALLSAGTTVRFSCAD